MGEKKLTTYTVAQALDFLTARGCAASRAKVYRDLESGRLKGTPKAIPLSSLRTYAAKLSASQAHRPLPVEDDEDWDGKSDFWIAAAERKEIADTDKLVAQAALAELRLKLAKGDVVPRDAYLAELASRLVNLREGFRLEAESRAQEVVAAAKGAPENARAVSGLLASILDDFLAELAQAKTYRVAISGDRASFQCDRQ